MFPNVLRFEVTVRCSDRRSSKLVRSFFTMQRYLVESPFDYNARLLQLNCTVHIARSVRPVLVYLQNRTLWCEARFCQKLIKCTRPEHSVSVTHSVAETELAVQHKWDDRLLQCRGHREAQKGTFLGGYREEGEVVGSTPRGEDYWEGRRWKRSIPSFRRTKQRLYSSKIAKSKFLITIFRFFWLKVSSQDWRKSGRKSQ